MCPTHQNVNAAIKHYSMHIRVKRRHRLNESGAI
ncbi:hypothetical protein FRAAL5438 [Frankia alni ACN14a]|uniref:Transposase n=1 Tax=Frankia alni (strain DSM 45986 / CECT 9034 / ACN14a) TaxID=326424 RepID=Q0REN7_FRAAA|nr:hypothetical protein FRAAL5438 [Frankia alni ACN14a]